MVCWSWRNGVSVVEERVVGLGETRGVFAHLMNEASKKKIPLPAAYHLFRL